MIRWDRGVTIILGSEEPIPGDDILDVMMKRRPAWRFGRRVCRSAGGAYAGREQLLQQRCFPESRRAVSFGLPGNTAAVSSLDAEPCLERQAMCIKATKCT